MTMRRAIGRLAKAVGIVFAVVLAGMAILVGSIELGCRGPSVAAVQPEARGAYAIDVPGYRRDESSTYFTFPEWYIVYAAEDLARFVETGKESGFGYLSAITSFWDSFCTIKRRTHGRAEATTDVSVMIYTIGLSFSAEYAIKGLYETTVGRVTEWLRGDEPTPEDRFAHRVAHDYAAFLYATPWYKYPFFAELQRLWRETPTAGAAQVRKWERRFALSSEYLVKSIYGFVIQKAMDVSNDEDPRDIMLVVRGLTDADLAAEPRIRLVKELGGASLVVVPRYQVFSDIAVELSRKGRVIAEIAGNHNILMTAILRDGTAPSTEGMSELFAMPLSARPGFRRAGFDIKVDALPDVVRALDRDHVAIEHLFDY
jgi:hypothetical protein